MKLKGKSILFRLLCNNYHFRRQLIPLITQDEYTDAIFQNVPEVRKEQVAAAVKQKPLAQRMVSIFVFIKHKCFTEISEYGETYVLRSGVAKDDRLGRFSSTRK